MKKPRIDLQAGEATVDSPQLPIRFFLRVFQSDLLQQKIKLTSTTLFVYLETAVEVKISPRVLTPFARFLLFFIDIHKKNIEYNKIADFAQCRALITNISLVVC